MRKTLFSRLEGIETGMGLLTAEQNAAGDFEKPVENYWTRMLFSVGFSNRISVLIF
jgi:hypothetical protein